MMHFSKTLKTTALAGLFGLGFVVAMTSPALADRAYTRCDRDGDRCWRVVCDNDGDDCRSYRVNTRYYDYRNGYDGYRSDDRDRWQDRRHARWVCDHDGDYCRWRYDRW